MTEEHDSKALVSAPVQSLHPLVEAVLQRDASVEDLRAFLELQREYEAGEAKKAFDVAMVGLKRELPHVVEHNREASFSGRGGNVSYSYADLASVVSAVVDILTDHGFSHAWHPSTTQQSVTVRTVLSHQAGHSISVELTSPIDNRGSKSAPQAILATITSLQRYGLLSILGLATADMREPHGAEQAEPAPESVDEGRNLRAAAAIRKAKGSVADWERRLGRATAHWTAADLAEIRSALGLLRADVR